MNCAAAHSLRVSSSLSDTRGTKGAPFYQVITLRAPRRSTPAMKYGFILTLCKVYEGNFNTRYTHINSGPERTKPYNKGDIKTIVGGTDKTKMQLMRSAAQEIARHKKILLLQSFNYTSPSP